MLHISLLGGQVVTDGNSILRTRSSRTLMLVAFLAVHAGVPQPRQRIAGLFWPESTDEQALTNLRRELHQLRQILGADPSLVANQRDLCWQDSATCEVDVRAFDRHHAAAVAAAHAGNDAETLAQAYAGVARYRGELMPGSYEDWLIEPRTEREQHCVDLLDLVCATSDSAGDLTHAIDAARRRIQLRPLEEIGYRTLIRLQRDIGDRAGALSTYHHCASVLERELGVDPSPATRAAMERLLSSAPSLKPRPDGGRRSRSGPAIAALIGRDAEFDRLHAVWRTAAAGRAAVVLVHGDPGVGKTRFVAELAAVVRSHDALVASARCFGTSGRLALAPVADWLRPPAIQASAATLDPVWRAEVERLVPSARANSEGTGTARAMVDAWRRQRFFEGLAQALGAVNRPLLLVLDNVQWCDQETLSFLTYCLTRASTAPILLAGTLREDDHEPALAEWISHMRASGALTEIGLQPLALADTVRLAEAISKRPMSENDARLLHATTGGFPLYVVEAARGLAGRENGSLPVGDLGALLDSRFAQLTPPAREVAGLAAAVGRDFSLDLLAHASDRSSDMVVDGVDELWRHRIVRESGAGYDFSHDLLRERAYAAVSPPRRWLLHRRLAQSLELAHADNPDSVSAQLADQYARGGRDDRAISYYRRAADVAAARFANAEAIRLHRLALTLVRRLPDSPERDRQELRLLEAIAAPLNALYGYASPELRDVVERTILLAESLGDRDSLFTALVGLFASQFVQGFTADSYRTAERTLALVPSGSELSGPAHFAAGCSTFSLGRPDDALEHFALAVRFGSTHSLTIATRPNVHGRAFAAHAHWLLGDSDMARACAREAKAMARADDTPYSLAVALAYSAITHQLCGDQDALADDITGVRDLCERHDFAYYREWGLILGGWLRGDLEGRDIARGGIDALIAQGALARMPYWLSLVAELSERVGDAPRARADLDAALVGAAARDDVWWLPEVMRRRARYDDEEAAVERLRTAIDLARSQRSPTLMGRCAADLEARRSERRAGVPNRF